jgi:hypothetical protein
MLHLWKCIHKPSTFHQLMVQINVNLKKKITLDNVMWVHDDVFHWDQMLCNQGSNFEVQMSSSMPRHDVKKMIKWSFSPKLKFSYNGIFLQLAKYVDRWPNISPMVCLPWWICIHFLKCASFPISYGKCSKFQVILKYVRYFMVQSIGN